MLVLSHDDVEALLPMADCIEAMDAAMRGLVRGDFYQPLRLKARPEGVANRMAFMPALRKKGRPLWGVKEIVITPDNATRGLDPHQGAVVLHDGENGTLLAIINASAITATRTAAVSALATRALARKEASSVAILGAGVQARAHIAALRCVLPRAQYWIWSRTGAHAEALAGETNAQVAASAEMACVNADVVCTLTGAATPIVRRDWFAKGCHINAVGASIASARELDGTTMAAGTLFVDRRESTLNESGDYLLAGGGGHGFAARR
jgi:ornithine cyclodeaminase/alanine dehydrogenase-like protein (mu-crystallin family)